MGCIRRRLLIIGILMVILSMTMATQYATMKISYSYGIVHPSNADIRFVGADNSSADEPRALRIPQNISGSQYVQLNLGNQSLGAVRNYTASFAIVNEEQFAVNITYINISGNGSTFLSIWLHGNRSTEAALEESTARLQMVDSGVSLTTANTNAWILASGNGDPSDMNGTAIQTPWDETAHVRYNDTTTIFAKNQTRDWVWVHISMVFPAETMIGPPYSGSIWIHFKASTH